MSVVASLLRLWRPMILWFAAILVTVEVVAVTAISAAGPVQFSFWLVVAGAAAKYWPLVAGILLVSTNFRLLVANGVTRHEFLAGAGVFGLVLVAGLVEGDHAGGVVSQPRRWTSSVRNWRNSGPRSSRSQASSTVARR